MLSALLNQGGWMLLHWFRQTHCPDWTCNQSHFHPRHLAVPSIFSADTCVKGPGLWRPGLEEGAMHRCLLTEILCSPESAERFLRMMVEKDATIGTFLCLVSFCTSMYSASSTDQGGRPGMTWLTPRVLLPYVKWCVQVTTSFLLVLSCMFIWDIKKLGVEVSLVLPNITQPGRSGKTRRKLSTYPVSTDVALACVIS